MNADDFSPSVSKPKRNARAAAGASPGPSRRARRQATSTRGAKGNRAYMQPDKPMKEPLALFSTAQGPSRVREPGHRSDPPRHHSAAVRGAGKKAITRGSAFRAAKARGPPPSMERRRSGVFEHAVHSARFPIKDLATFVDGARHRGPVSAHRAVKAARGDAAWPFCLPGFAFDRCHASDFDAEGRRPCREWWWGRCCK